MSFILAAGRQMVTDSYRFFLHYTPAYWTTIPRYMTALADSHFPSLVNRTRANLSNTFPLLHFQFWYLQQHALMLTTTLVLNQCNRATKGHVLFVIIGFSTFTMSSTISHSTWVTSYKHSCSTKAYVWSSMWKRFWVCFQGYFWLSFSF